MQIINDMGAGGRIGAALGAGLQQLAQNKLAAMQQRAQASALESLGRQDFTPQQRFQAVSFLPPELQKVVLQNIDQLLEQPRGQQYQQYSQEPQFEVRGGPLDQLMRSSPAADPLRELMMTSPYQVQIPGQLEQGVAQQVLEGKFPQIQQQQRKIGELFKSPQQRMQEKGLALKEASLEERKIAREGTEKARQQKFAYQQTKDYVDTVLKKQKSIKEDNLRLDRMSKLIKDNKLPNAGLWSFLTDLEETGAIKAGGAGALIGGTIGSIVPGVGNIAGTGIGAALGGIGGALLSPLAGIAKSIIRAGSPDIEEYEKLSADFIKNAKQYFGSRITDADLRAYLKTIPTLMQTNAGKERVIQNLKSVGNIAQLEADTVREIIKENDGKRPLDLEQQVYDKISNKIDQLAQQFMMR